MLSVCSGVSLQTTRDLARHNSSSDARLIHLQQANRTATDTRFPYILGHNVDLTNPSTNCTASKTAQQEAICTRHNRQQAEHILWFAGAPPCKYCVTAAVYKDTCSVGATARGVTTSISFELVCGAFLPLEQSLRSRHNISASALVQSRGGSPTFSTV